MKRKKYYRKQFLALLLSGVLTAGTLQGVAFAAAVPVDPEQVSGMETEFSDAEGSFDVETLEDVEPHENEADDYENSSEDVKETYTTEDSDRQNIESSVTLDQESGEAEPETDLTQPDSAENSEPGTETGEAPSDEINAGETDADKSQAGADSEGLTDTETSDDANDPDGSSVGNEETGSGAGGMGSVGPENDNASDDDSGEEIPASNTEQQEYYYLTLDATDGYFPGDVYEDDSYTANNSFDPTVLTIPVKKGKEARLDIREIYSDDNHLEFAGWSLTKGGDPILKEDGGLATRFTPSEDTTLYAVWTEYCFLTLVAGDGYFNGDLTDDMSGKEEYRPKTLHKKAKRGKEVSFSDVEAVSSDTQKKFAGWSKTPGGEYLMDQSRKAITSVLLDEDTTLYANYTDEIKITLDANGGEFYGWFWDDDADIRVPDPGNDKVVVLNTQMGAAVKLGETMTKQVGYSFAGWSLEKNGTPLKGSENHNTFTYAPEKDCTLYAIYKKTDYIITYSANGGYLEGEYPDFGSETNVKNGSTVHCGVTIGDAAPLDYYTVKNKNADLVFTGWSTTKGGTPLKTLVPKRDMTLYATWATYYRITFNANGGYIETTNKPKTLLKRVKKGSSISLPQDVRINNTTKIFAGWSTTKNGSPLVNSSKKLLTTYKPVKSLTLYAVWADACTVKLDTTGGYIEGTYFNPVTGKDMVNPKTMTIKVRKGQSIATYSGSVVTNNTKKIFAGWSTSKTGKPILNKMGLPADSYKPTKNCTLYAIWKDKCTVTLDFTGGYLPGTYWDSRQNKKIKNPAKLGVDLVKGDKLHLNQYDTAAIKSTTKIFKGWSTKKNGAIISPASVDKYYKVTKNCTLYAVWQNAYTIAFNGNGGSFREWDGVKWTAKGKVIKIKFPKNYTLGLGNHQVVAAKKGSKLLGWSRTAKGKALSPTVEGNIRTNTTLYAVWSKPVTKVSLSKSSVSVLKGKTVTLKATCLPSNAYNKKVKWASSNKKVATVTAKGVVKGVSKGTCTITATAADGSGKKATCKITVK